MTESIINQIVREYPPATQNNSRSIVRHDLERLRAMGKRGVHIAQEKYNVDLDYLPEDEEVREPRPDYNPGDPSDMSDPF